jgi:hypothetical protein
MRVLVPVDLPMLRLEEMQNLTKLCACHICPKQTILMALNTPVFQPAAFDFFVAMHFRFRRTSPPK